VSEVGPAPITFLFNGQPEQRLDHFLVECLPELSRARIQGLIKDGAVTVNGILPRKAGQMLEGQATVQVWLPATRPSNLVPEALPLDIIFENDDLLVVNKPAGMVVHPSAGHSSGTLVHAALAHAPELEGIGGEQRPGVVHRLDKDTSGLILLAKNDLTHRWLQDQFSSRRIEKNYLALVDGHPPSATGRIEAPTGRDPRSRQKMAILTIDKGREAVSEYWTKECFRTGSGEHTLLEVHPITGRTHQIRLHLAFIGCPVAGDRMYGNRHTTLYRRDGTPLERHFLHAARLSVRLQNEDVPRTFTAPLPVELVEVLDVLRELVAAGSNEHSKENL
jgi:23S rRNA pseudouridine1911/1915/1917 synthase